MMTFWKTVSTAPYDRDLELAVADWSGTHHALSFPCRRVVEDRWVNAVTGRRVEVKPTHWRTWTEESRR